LPRGLLCVMLDRGMRLGVLLALAGAAFAQGHRAFDLPTCDYARVAGEEGWRIDDGLLVSLTEVLPLEAGTPVDRIDRGAALRRLLARERPPADLVLAHWVAARQAGEAGDAALARKAIPDQALAKLRETWPEAWQRGKRPDLALLALAALPDDTTVQRWRRHVATAHVELAGAPKPDTPRAQAARLWIERFQEHQPLWTCFRGTPPAFLGEPDAELALYGLRPEAYPVLVAALRDPRLTRPQQYSFHTGDPMRVGKVAWWMLSKLLGIREDEDTLEHWIDSGTWKDRAATHRWFAAHTKNPSSLMAIAPWAAKDPQAVEALRHRLQDDDYYIHLAACLRLDDATLIKVAARMPRQPELRSM